ncbi:MAG: MarR family winged helix-turn-helix transcriptional regulator [Kofleriaceae bacterium]
MQRLWKLAHGLEVRSKRMARTIGITGPQRLVIRIVGQRSRPTASDLAHTLGIHPSTLTGIVRRLEQQGLLVRRVDSTDRRRARFQLTARGRNVDRERQGTVEAAVRRTLGRVDRSAIEQTARVLEVLTAELSRTD